MGKIIIVVESGADVPKEFIKDDNVFVVPMHVIMDDKNLNDGDFPQADIFTYYQQTSKIPTTSAPSPNEYRQIFREIHTKYPDSSILHLCYSAATTSSMQNAIIGSEGMDFVRHVDSKCVTAGQALLVMRTDAYIRQNPQADMDKVVKIVETWIPRCRMVFVPANLDFLKAGGRVSNAAYLGASMLNIRPAIELIDGKLVCGRKYRGSMGKIIEKLLTEKLDLYHFEKGQFRFVYTDGLDKDLMRQAEKIAEDFGIKDVSWMKAGSAVSVHGGPGVFGFCCIEKENCNS